MPAIPKRENAVSKQENAVYKRETAVIDDLRERIVEVARKRFEELGFSKVTMEEIAEELQISKKTLYKHFANKEELIRMYIHQVLNERRAAFDAIVSDSRLPLTGKLHALVHQIGIQTSRVSPRLFGEVATISPDLRKEVESFQNERIEAFGAMMKEGIRDGQIRSDLDEELVMRIYFAAIRSVVDIKNIAENHYTPKQIFSTLIAVLFEGVLTPKARREYAKQKKNYDALSSRPVARRMNMLAVILLLAIGISVRARAQDPTPGTLTLSEAVQIAIHNSPALAEGEASVDRAKAHYREMESYAYPQLAADASYTRIDPVVSLAVPGSPISIKTAANDNYNGNLNVQQPIWTFGRLGAEDRVAKSGIKSAQDNLDQYRARAAYQTTQVYYDILTTDQGIKVERQQVSVLNGNLSDARKRVQQGTATSLDTLDIQARISQTQSQIDELESTRAKQVSMLRRLLGMAPGTDVTVTQPPPARGLPEQEDTLLSLAEKQRPELIAAEDAQTTARLEIDQARNENDPLLSANVVGGVKDGYLPNLTQGKLNWAGTVSLHVPILDGGRTHAQVDEAEAEYRAAQARVEDAKRGVQSDIEQALADLESSRSRLMLVKVQIDQAQKALNVAQLRYTNGVATNLDVLTAQSALEQAELQQAQLMFGVELSEYNLNRAVGTPMW